MVVHGLRQRSLPPPLSHHPLCDPYINRQTEIPRIEPETFCTQSLYYTVSPIFKICLSVSGRIQSKVMFLQKFNSFFKFYSMLAPCVSWEKGVSCSGFHLHVLGASAYIGFSADPHSSGEQLQTQYKVLKAGSGRKVARERTYFRPPLYQNIFCHSSYSP